MNKKIKLSLFLALPLLLCMTQSHATDQFYQQVIGEASGLQNGESLYKEIHCGTENELASDVYYESNDGALIAHKTLNYQLGLTTPSFTQTYAQNQEKVKVEMDHKTLMMSMTARDGKEINQAYKVSELGQIPVVIDAGFDVFIRDNWEKLVSGNTKTFQFPLVSQAQLITLRVKKALCQYETKTDQCFALEPSNWLFRMLASPIELGYDSILMRLNRYRGLANINNANGDGLVVDIRYQYQEVGVACQFLKAHKAENI